MNVDESLMQQCVGRVSFKLCNDVAKWRRHENVTVNGEPRVPAPVQPYMHFGGCITILVSGQPEKASRQTEQHGRCRI